MSVSLATAAIIAAIVGVVGTVAGSAAQIGYDAWQQENNRQFNRQEAEVSRDWSSTENLLNRQFEAAEAQKARDFQEYMADNQYQKMVASMQAAGINPTVALSGGSSGLSSFNSSIGRGSNQGSPVASVGNPGGNGLGNFGSIIDTAVGNYQKMLNAATVYKELTGVDGKTALKEVQEVFDGEIATTARESLSDVIKLLPLDNAAYLKKLIDEL